MIFQMTGADWRLTVSDNGAGRAKHERSNHGGLGTALVSALAKQLDAIISESSTGAGLTVAITRGTLAADLPLAA